jgi:hypothetical protein
MAQKPLRKVLLSLSIAALLTCSWSGTVFADGDRVSDLEARIAELEALVHQLLQNQQQAPPPVETAAIEAKAEQAAEAAAEAKVVAMMGEHQEAVAEKVHKHSYKFGGFIKADVIYSDFGDGPYSGAGRDFYIPATVQVGGEGESYLDFHAKESRINFKSTHLLDNGAKLGTFFEMDFQLSGHGDERISNSYNPRVRHAFLTYNKWLFGQTWMTFFNVGALPENLDFVGPAESTIFGRQVMIRYTNGPFQFAIENPETTITPYEGGGRIVADDSRIPDVVLRYNLSGDWGGFTAAGILRPDMRYENSDSGINDSTTGYGISLSGKFKIGEKDDFRWMASAGGGLGRYLGLNLANGAVLDADGNLDVIDSAGIFGSFRHFWNNKWRSNLTLGYTKVDNDTALTGMKVTKNAQSVHVNLIYNPVPKLDFGIEFLYADRELESGADGDLKRVQFSAKYAY